MSFILDALRKVEERERQRESTPLGPGPAMPSGPGRGPGRRHLRLATALLAVSLCLLWGVWMVMERGPGSLETAVAVLPGARERSTSPPTELPALREEASAGRTRPAPVGVDEGRGVTAPPAAILPEDPPPDETGRGPAEHPTRPEPPPPPRPTVAAGKSLSPTGALAETIGGGGPDVGEEEDLPPAVAEGPDPGRIYSIEELPGPVKGALGDLKISGHVWSEDPAYRVLMVNGGVKREGDAFGAGLILTEITERGAVFFFGGYQIGVTAF